MTVRCVIWLGGRRWLFVLGDGLRIELEGVVAIRFYAKPSAELAALGKVVP